VQLERIAWNGGPVPREEELRRRLEDEGFSVWAWTDPPGADYVAHSHDHDESLWVVSGAITFGVDGARYRLEAGDRLMLPRGTVHTAEAGSSGATYLIGER
jgi:quercetin dioxygenase-like cupin family protein